MDKRVFNYFEMCGKIATSKDDQRSFLLGAIGIRKDGKIVKSFNGPAKIKMRCAHAEYRISNKLDYGATVYVARVRLIDGAFGIAKPCRNCVKALKAKRVKRVYYTIGPQEYGFIDL